MSRPWTADDVAVVRRDLADTERRLHRLRWTMPVGPEAARSHQRQLRMVREHRRQLAQLLADATR